MMVTFVSQCEKNALDKTRRVLDAFANRIGDNAWQTVITEEGLLAVKKLLRKTANKNTAVSCHWIRSRSRSDLMWVVGNRGKFNAEGFVAVNYTEKEVVMDRMPIKNQLLANTKSQPLNQHLFAVGYVAYLLLKKINIKEPKIKQSAFIAGVFHDIGKIDPHFQTWVKNKVQKDSEDYFSEDGVHIDAPKKFSFEEHPRHHELSWLLAESIIDGKMLNDVQLAQIAHGIYWHHTKPFRKDDKFTKAEAIYEIFKKSLSDGDISNLYFLALRLLEEVSNLTSNIDELSGLMPDFIEKFKLTKNEFPVYKKYNDWFDKIDEYKQNVRENSLNNLVRTAVISADRLVSSCSAEDLAEYISENSLENILDGLTVDESHLSDAIKQCLKGFEDRFPESERNKAQNQASKSLADLKEYAQINESSNIGVLQGPAGCGKTKIALEWASRTNAKKIIWVCPRVQVCLGLLNDLSSEEYLPSTRIEIFTGEYKKILSNGIKFDEAQDTEEDDYFSGDIVLTTIDQAINSIITHNKIDTMIHVMQSHVVFDEFHELINMPAFNLFFAELIGAKRMQGDYANTLLVSATPHYFFLKKFLNIPEADIVKIDSFNSSSYSLEFVSYDEKGASPLITQSQIGKTFVITNTAQDAQLGYLSNYHAENSILFHAKYTKQDQTDLFNKIFECYKRGGNKNYDVLRSGPIIQASLNITCDKMLTELTSAENWLQRLGRLDRFGENSEPNPYITFLPDSVLKNGKQTSSCTKFLNQLCIFESTKAWVKFIQDKLEEQQNISINKLYAIYKDFYEDLKSLKSIEQDFLKALKKSVELIKDKVMDPISVPPKPKKQNGVVKISKNSLRGDNRFVQMAVCNVTEDLSKNFINEYAYSEEFNSNQPNPCLTASIESMRGYGENDNNLVEFMRSKHHNIKSSSGYKKARNDWELIKAARSPEFPIYLSYTPKDLESIGGKAHSQAIYYVTSNKQPVGAMCISKLCHNLQSEKSE